MKFTTRALHTSYIPTQSDGAIIPPLHLTSTFAYANQGGVKPEGMSDQEWQKSRQQRFGNDGWYDYSRTINPTRQILEDTIAALDGNKYGLAYSSGSAVLVNLIATLKAGEKVLFSTDVYGGTYRYIVRVANPQGLGYEIADLTDLNLVETKLKTGTIRLVWLETPTNPMLKVTDIAALAKLVHKYNALLIVDNTFASPILQQPSQLGADIVVYSTTKYINGHSDSVGGALTLSDDKLYTQLKFIQNSIGAILSPFDSWLTLRGLRTLELRMERHAKNADAIVPYLQKHPKVAAVYYPGSHSKDQAEIVKKQMSHPGGMVSLELMPGADMHTFFKGLKLIRLAESLGGVESLIDHPASMTHGSIPKEERIKIGLKDELMRLSIGIENSEDLIEDLSNALHQA